jgi:hypothetical protein
MPDNMQKHSSRPEAMTYKTPSIDANEQVDANWQ